MTDPTGAVAAVTTNVNISFDNGVPVKTRGKFTRTSGTAVIVLEGN